MNEAPRHHLNKHLDNIPDGTTYSRILSTRVNTGRPTIDFSEAIHNNKNVDNIGDGSTYSRTLGTRVNSGRPTIDFSEAIHNNKNVDNIGDGSTYARPLASALSSGAVKAAHISNQAVGQQTIGATLCQGSPGTNLVFSGWRKVASTTINVPAGTTSITLTCNQPAQAGGGAGSGFQGIGFAIYSGADPGTPQVFHSGGSGSFSLALSSPVSGNGLTLALYVTGSGVNDGLSTSALSSMTQTVVQILNAGALA